MTESSPSTPTDAVIVIFKARDVIFAEIGSRLHFDEHEQVFARVGDAVFSLHRDDDMLVRAQGNLLFADHCL